MWQIPAWCKKSSGLSKCWPACSFMQAFHANSSMWQSSTAFPHLIPRWWCVRRNNFHTVAAKDHKKHLSNVWTWHLLAVSSSVMLTSCDTVLQDGLAGDLKHHLPYGPLLHHTVSYGCSEARFTGGRDRECSARFNVCSSVYRWCFVFFCMLEPGRNKLFSDYRDLSYMHIVLGYTGCLITNILEIADSSGRPHSFLQSHSMSFIVPWKGLCFIAQFPSSSLKLTFVCVFHRCSWSTCWKALTRASFHCFQY